MKKLMDNETLRAELASLSCDAKAEVLVAEAMGKQFSDQDFMIFCDGLFAREYSSDLTKIELKEDLKNLEMLQLHLTRAGIYDHLPEGLFYQPQDHPIKGTGAIHMAYLHRLNKEKEAKIRKFFLPFENEFFLQKVHVEAEENTLIDDMRHGLMNDFFIDFWGISTSVPKSMQTAFAALLPYASAIAGDPEKTASCLEYLLKEPVNARLTFSSRIDIPNTLGFMLGKRCLGSEIVLGDESPEESPGLEFSIGPLKNSGLVDYLEGGVRHAFLESFYQFFVPVGVEVVTTLLLGERRQTMSLADSDRPILGYSSFL